MFSKRSDRPASTSKPALLNFTGSDHSAASARHGPRQWHRLSAGRAGAFAPVGLLVAALLITGCSTPNTREPSSNVRSQTAETSPSFDRLIKGMRRAEVSAYLGAANEVRPMVSEGAEGEIWVYTRTFPGGTRQVSTETVDIPTVNPFTGEAGIIKEPVYRNERTIITEVTELLFVRDLLVEWKQKRLADRHLD